MELIRFKDVLDSYHERRALKHGYLYIVTRRGPMNLMEGKSIATGKTLTIFREYVEEVSDEEGPELP
jgi:hypothetical protein